MSVENILSILKTIKIGIVLLESDVTSEIEAKLIEHGIKYSREVKLGKHCRVDILIDGGIAIEIKKGKPNSKLVANQLIRYSESEKVSSIVLVSERGLFSHIKEANGKRVYYVSLSSNWGVSL